MNYILITGGLGFIGSNLAKHFLQDPNNFIIVVDNLVTGKHSNLDSHKNLKVFEMNITNTNFFSYVVNNYPIIHEIYNFACIASPKTYQEFPLDTLNTCYIGTSNCLNLAKFYSCKFLQASTSEIYGDPLITPQSINYYGNVNTVGCRSMYDEGKRVAETLVSVYRNDCINPKDYHIARIFNTFGNNMDKNDGRVVSNFINNALENKDLEIYGNGTQTRSLIYIDDQIQGLITLMHSNLFLANVGSEFEIDVKSFAFKILELIPESKSKIVFKDKLMDDPMQRRGDYSEMYSLGWKTKIQLDLGLKLTIEYYKSLQ